MTTEEIREYGLFSKLYVVDRRSVRRIVQLLPYYDYAYVSKRVKEFGLVEKKRHNDLKMVTDMLEDWNSGMPVHDILVKYRFASIRKLYSFVGYHRHKGVPFANHFDLCKDKFKLMETDWNNGMLTSELVIKYDYIDQKSLRGTIARLRQKGYNFNRRRN